MPGGMLTIIERNRTFARFESKMNGIGAFHLVDHIAIEENCEKDFTFHNPCRLQGLADSVENPNPRDKAAGSSVGKSDANSVVPAAGGGGYFWLAIVTQGVALG